MYLELQSQGENYYEHLHIINASHFVRACAAFLSTSLQLFTVEYREVGVHHDRDELEKRLGVRGIKTSER